MKTGLRVTLGEGEEGGGNKGLEDRRNPHSSKVVG